MRNKKNLLTRICMIVCAVLSLALIVTQFMPCWSQTVEIKTRDENGKRIRIDVEKDLSVWGYLSNPEEDVQEQFGETFEEELGEDESGEPIFNINDMAGTAVIILAFGILTIIFTLLKSHRNWVCVFPLICGIGGLYGYLMNPIFKTCSNWIIPTILSAAIAAVALIPAVFFILGISKWFKEEK